MFGATVSVLRLDSGQGYYLIEEPQLRCGRAGSRVWATPMAIRRFQRPVSALGASLDRMLLRRASKIRLPHHPRLGRPGNKGAERGVTNSEWLLGAVEEWLLRSGLPLGPEGNELNLVLRASEALGLLEAARPCLGALSYYVWRDLLYFGRASIPLRDPLVEEVSLESYQRPISVLHRSYPELGWIDTNISFSGESEVQGTVRRLAHSAGKEVSVAFPYLDVVTPSGDRVSLTFSSEVSLPGSSFSVRKFPSRPLLVKDLVANGTMSALMAAYYSLLLDDRSVIIVVGPMSSGKTTLLSALASLIPENSKVVTIEDVPELRLSLERWQRFVSRSARPGRGMSVDLMDLLQLSMRYRPDYIILGETRGVEVQAFMQAAALGHGAMTTFHADGPQSALTRLSMPPLSVGEAGLSLISAFSLMQRVKVNGGKEERINVKVSELWRGRLAEIFLWKPSSGFYPSDTAHLVERSPHLRQAFRDWGWSEAQGLRELRERERSFHEAAFSEEQIHQAAKTLSKSTEVEGVKVKRDNGGPPTLSWYLLEVCLIALASSTLVARAAGSFPKERCRAFESAAWLIGALFLVFVPLRLDLGPRWVAGLLAAEVALLLASRLFRWENWGLSVELPFLETHFAQSRALGLGLDQAALLLRGSPLKESESSLPELLSGASKKKEAHAFERFIEDYRFNEMIGVDPREYLAAASKNALDGLEDTWNSFVGNASALAEISVGAFALMPAVWAAIGYFSVQFMALLPDLVVGLVALFALLVFAAERITPTFPSPRTPPAWPVVVFLSSGLLMLPLQPMPSILFAAESVAGYFGFTRLFSLERDVREMRAMSQLFMELKAEAEVGMGPAYALERISVHFPQQLLRRMLSDWLGSLRVGSPLRAAGDGFSLFLSWLLAAQMQGGELDAVSLGLLSRFSEGLSASLSKLRTSLNGLLAISVASPLLSALSISAVGGAASPAVYPLSVLSSIMCAVLMGKLAGGSWTFVLPLALSLPVVIAGAIFL